MPQPLKPAVITDRGIALLNRVQTGQIKLEVTRMVTGNGNYTNDEKDRLELQKRTSLKSLKNSYPLSDIDVLTSNSAKVTALLTNQDPVTLEPLVDAGYYINEIGIYAKPQGGADTEEVLYSMTVTEGSSGDFMPPYNGVSPAQITQDYILTVDNALEVTVNISGAALLAEDANKIKDDTTHQKYKVGVDNGLMYYQLIQE